MSDLDKALAAALDAAPCVCGEPTLGVVHRADGPCYLPEQAPPAAAVPAGKDWQAEAMKHAQSALYWRERCEMLEDPVRKAQQPAAAVPDVEAKYAEILYAVESKWPGESRHETALRYIREREAGTLSTGPQSAMLAAAPAPNKEANRG